VSILPHSVYFAS